MSLDFVHGPEIWRFRASRLADGPGANQGSDRETRGDDARRASRGRRTVGLDLGVRPLSYGAAPGDGGHLRVLDDHLDAGARHKTRAGWPDGRLQRIPEPGALRQDRIDG